MRRYSPWRDAAQRHPGVHIDWCEDIAPAAGAWVPSEQVILLRRSLTRAERDDTLAHELAHVDLEHEPSGHPWFDRRQELHAGRLGRARLMPVDVLAKALADYDGDPDLVAEALDVPVGTLRKRCAELTDREKAAIGSVVESDHGRRRRGAGPRRCRVCTGRPGDHDDEHIECS